MNEQLDNETFEKKVNNVSPEKIKIMFELLGEIVVMVFNFINIFKKTNEKK